VTRQHIEENACQRAGLLRTATQAIVARGKGSEGAAVAAECVLKLLQHAIMAAMNIVKAHSSHDESVGTELLEPLKVLCFGSNMPHALFDNACLGVHLLFNGTFCLCS
jgi:hypothetical protein